MRTQKAKGIEALKEHSMHLMFNGAIAPLPFQFVAEVADLGKLKWKGEPLFARPCPVVPRHGFVDSRPIRNQEEAKELFDEAREVDELAEMIVMPYINASHSMIWTPGVLTVGLGNDGATAGHDSVSIKTSSQPPIAGTKLAAASGIESPDVPYMEFVRDTRPALELWRVVQMRGGPNIADLGDDYLPCQTKCKRIVEAKGDLLEWETKVKALKSGDVVYHPGGSLSSHYGVHSKLNNVPIFTSKEPVIGTTYNLCACPKEGRKSAGDWCVACEGYCGVVSELDVEETLKGISQGMVLDVPFERDPQNPDIDGQAVKLLLGAIHNVSFFGKKESRLLGVALALTIKLALCACFGEARHKGEKNLQREQIYKAAWADVAGYVQRFNEARKKFYSKGWSPGFGGKAWARCADATAKLWNATVVFVRSKSQDDLKAVVAALNEVVNCAHNNGWWFNKFIDPRWFDIAVQYPSAPLIVTGHLIHTILKENVSTKGLIAEIESCEGTPKPLPKPEQFGGFTVVYTADMSQPWNSHQHNLAIHFDDGSVKNCSSVMGIARAYLKKIGEAEPSKERIRAVRDEIEAIIGTPDKYLGGASQSWLIPNIDQADMMRTAKAARCILRGSILHLQIVYLGEDGYTPVDKKIPLTDANAIMEWFVKAPKTISMSGSSAEYANMEIKSDGIYAGQVKLVNLKNFKEGV